MAESKQEWRNASDKGESIKAACLTYECDKDRVIEEVSGEQPNNPLSGVAVIKATGHRIKSVKNINGENIINYESQDGKSYRAKAENDQWKTLLNEQQEKTNREGEEK